LHARDLLFSPHPGYKGIPASIFAVVETPRPDVVGTAILSSVLPLPWLLACFSSSSDSANHEVIECRDRVRLRPEADLPRAKAGVTLIQQELAVEGRVDMIVRCDDP